MCARALTDLTASYGCIVKERARLTGHATVVGGDVQLPNRSYCQAGCDQNDGKTYNESLMNALAANMLTEQDIDLALTRVLTQRFKVGAFDPP